MARSKKHCFEGRKLEPQLIIARAMSALNAYQKANAPQEVEPQASLVTNDITQLWKPPEEGIFKQNTDVAEVCDYRWGAGVIICDHKGRFMRQQRGSFIAVQKQDFLKRCWVEIGAGLGARHESGKSEHRV